MRNLKTKLMVTAFGLSAVFAPRAAAREYTPAPAVENGELYLSEAQKIKLGALGAFFVICAAGSIAIIRGQEKEGMDWDGHGRVNNLPGGHDPSFADLKESAKLMGAEDDSFESLIESAQELHPN